MRTLRRCRSKFEANEFYIDVDTYNYDVIVLDIPESHSKKQASSDDKSRSVNTYIYIDDDESPCNHHAAEDLDRERNFEHGASSSRRYGPENVSPLKLSKGKRTYSGRGFNAELGSDSSDDDGPDCEFLEDLSGKVREQWEKASLKRKAVVQNDREFGGNKNTEKHVQDFDIGGTSRMENGVSFTCDARNIDGSKDDLPVGESLEEELLAREEENEKNDVDLPVDIGGTSSEEENEKNDSEVVTTIDDDVEDNDDDDVEDNDDDDVGDVAVESSIIDQREKLKETDEYKRALEEELLAREQALKIQAEEAQQLRRMQKRKKAECLRLLDMERRQKQRVEEIRESQKKDEENMNLKEEYRMEVRQELKNLEITCVDMASLLRGLGIQVGKGPVPLMHEVRVAYKKALLSFHPDRASGSDMRQQVEAEEKFKLISRMKEKFLL